LAGWRANNREAPIPCHMTSRRPPATSAVSGCGYAPRPGSSCPPARSWRSGPGWPVACTLGIAGLPEPHDPIVGAVGSAGQ